MSAGVYETTNPGIRVEVEHNDVAREVAREYWGIDVVGGAL